MTTYKLGNRVFTSKELIRKYISSILHGHNFGEVIKGEEAEIISELLTWHPDADQKIGIGVKLIFIGKDNFNGPCFWVLRQDGTKTDFSYRICIYGDPSKYQQFCSACRSAIEDQTMQYYQPGYDTHHAGFTFSEIVKGFIDHYQFDINKIEFQEGDMVMNRRFVDNKLVELFKVYHQERAVLKSIPRETHKLITREQKC